MNAMSTSPVTAVVVHPDAGAPNSGYADAGLVSSTGPFPGAGGKRKERIVVPQRSIGGGMDIKFEEDSYGLRLYGILSQEDYTDSITRLNETLKPSRATKVDAALLVTGPLLVPLGIWGVRHNGQVRKRKKLLRKAIGEFNASHPGLLMRWNRRPESSLTIEVRTAEHGAAPPASAVAGDAEVMSDVVVTEESFV